MGFEEDELKVRWIGVWGMRWSKVLSEIRFYAVNDRYPNILLLHVGGNDMALRPSRDVIRDIVGCFVFVVHVASIYFDLVRYSGQKKMAECQVS